MKKEIIGLLILITTIIACNDQAKKKEITYNASISGEITNSKGVTLILDKLSARSAIPVDTITLDEHGKFQFYTTVQQQEFYRIKVANDNFLVTILSVGDSAIIKADAKNLESTYSIKGSKEGEKLKELNQFLGKLYLSNDSLKKALKQHQITQNVNGYVNASNYQAVILDKRDRFIRQFIDDNPSSIASLAAVENLDPEQNFSYFKKVVKGLEKTASQSEYFLNLKARVDQLGKLALGAEAPEISLNTPQGNTASLSDLRGKVVLIDFWASWCRPCRMENPNVVKAYQKYRDQGFEVFSVSLDKSAPAWKQAIQQDGLNWTHVSDLRHWQSSVVKLYNIKGIPLTYLLDQEGKILAKNLRGKDLDRKLEEIFQM